MAQWSPDRACSPAALARPEPAQAATADGGWWSVEEILACGRRALYMVGLIVRKRKERENRGWQWAFCGQKLSPAPQVPLDFLGLPCERRLWFSLNPAQNEPIKM